MIIILEVDVRNKIKNNFPILENNWTIYFAIDPPVPTIRKQISEKNICKYVLAEVKLLPILLVKGQIPYKLDFSNDFMN